MNAYPRHPPWLKKAYVEGAASEAVEAALGELGLSTVCLAAACPNRSECYSRSTATFLILGETCTRNCAFCAIEPGKPAAPDATEPERVARAALRLGLKFVVVTSVTRDDLEDGGASQFAETIRQLRRADPAVRVEVLVPDFRGDPRAVRNVALAGPDVVNHNVETVPRLYPRVRPGTGFERSVDLLRRAKAAGPSVVTKSGLMLGLGETRDEVTGVLEELVEAGCDSVTIGQYLRPGPRNVEVARYVPPEEFDELREQAMGLGFRAVAAGPLVRSSYRAAETAAICGGRA